MKKRRLKIEFRRILRFLCLFIDIVRENFVLGFMFREFWVLFVMERGMCKVKGMCLLGF